MPYPDGIVNCDITTARCLPDEKGWYSLGIHPWNADSDDADKAFERVVQYADRENVKLIGECGIDTVRGAAPLFRQMLLFKKHIDLSESICKPLIIHEVKAHDVIVGLRKEYRCAQPWIIHGFRGKPSVAKMLLDAGCYLSFGENFNAETVAMVPLERLLAETDESSLSIAEIISRLSAARGIELTPTIERNLTRLLGY